VWNPRSTPWKIGKENMKYFNGRRAARDFEDENEEH
jgi:hypothetical protein